MTTGKHKLATTATKFVEGGGGLSRYFGLAMVLFVIVTLVAFLRETFYGETVPSKA